MVILWRWRRPRASAFWPNSYCQKRARQWVKRGWPWCRLSLEWGSCRWPAICPQISSRGAAASDRRFVVVQTRSHQPYHNWCASDFLERQKFYKKSRDFQCLYWGLTPQHLLPPWESGLIKEHRVILPSLFCLAFGFWYNRFLVYIVWRLWLPWSVMQASFVAVSGWEKCKGEKRRHYRRRRHHMWTLAWSSLMHIRFLTSIHGYLSRVRLGRGITESLQASKQRHTRSKIRWHRRTDRRT